uniref:homeobox protein Hox-B9 isoform X3 n=1 Tax=Halichoerus grypus TaxID=9711 RepID=UPI0016590FB5|nr:homeobox protein Hox-B9 isoform X3 [Halichoerus grypus]
MQRPEATRRGGQSPGGSRKDAASNSALEPGRGCAWGARTGGDVNHLKFINTVKFYCISGPQDLYPGGGAGGQADSCAPSDFPAGHVATRTLASGAGAGGSRARTGTGRWLRTFRTFRRPLPPRRRRRRRPEPKKMVVAFQAFCLGILGSCLHLDFPDLGEGGLEHLTALPYFSLGLSQTCPATRILEPDCLPSLVSLGHPLPGTVL